MFRLLHVHPIEPANNAKTSRDWVQGIQEATEENKPFIHLSLAELYGAQENTLALRQELEHLAAYEPVAPITQGLLYLEENNYQGIDALQTKLADGSEKDTLKGMSAEARNDWEQAGQHFFASSVSENPTWYALNALAGMWLNSKEIQYCKAYLEQVEQLAPNAPEVILTKARLYQETEQSDKAKKLKAHLLNLKGCFGRVRRMAQVSLR